MIEQSEPQSSDKLKNLRKLLLRVTVSTVLPMVSIGVISQELKDADTLETQAQKEKYQRQADEALLKSGQWRDPATDLIWTRCNVGQTWKGNSCKGEAKELNWWDAHTAALNHSEGGHSDWRLPTQPELASLMAGTVQQGKAAYLQAYKNGEERWAYQPAAGRKDLQESYFRSGQKGYVSPKLEMPYVNNFGDYWSTSKDKRYSSSAWGVDFNRGDTNSIVKSNKRGLHVRLVRASQSLEDGKAALFAFEQQAKTIDQDPHYLEDLEKQERYRQEEARRLQLAQQLAQRQAEARKLHLPIGSTAYVCAGTIFGENAMCKVEVLDESRDKIRVEHQTRCTSVAYKGYVQWVPKTSAITVEQVRGGLRCN